MPVDIPIATAPPMPQLISTSSTFSGASQSIRENTQPEPTAPPLDDMETTVNPPLTSSASSSPSSSTAYSFTGSDLNNKETIKPIGNSSGNNGTSANGTNKQDDEEKCDESVYECNICLDTAKDAVVSMCGHLFCWPCLHQWLEIRPNRKLCPVCKSAISKEKVIPLYGRNSTKQEDPRNKVPPRPAGQRSEPEPQFGFQGFPFGDGGFHMSFGIGAFPFGFFSSTFNIGEARPAGNLYFHPNRGTAQYENEQQLSKLFLYLAFLCIAWLVFA